MNKKQFTKGAVLITLLILPFLVYFFFVYLAEENFFVTLDYVGPIEITVDEKGDTLTEYYTIPEFSFTSQDDTLVSSDKLKNNIVLLNFFFSTCPSVCPAMNFNVQQVQERFKGYEYFKIVSISIDPEYDQVDVLKKYERLINATPGRWYFLTGNKDTIYDFASQVFLPANEDKSAPGGFLHSENVLLIDWDGHIRSSKDENGNIIGAYNSMDAVGLGELKDDIKVLIAEFEKKKSVDEYREQKANSRKK